MTAPDFIDPCGWGTPIWQCDISTYSPLITGQAAAIASEVLNMKTGMQFGACAMTIRPCARSCWGGDSWGGWGGGFNSWWQWGMWPRPLFFQGTWYNITCGSCSGDCSCSYVSECLLPTPVNTVTAVKVDGVTLTAGVDYRLDDYRKLVRLGGNIWPLCNNMNLADTQTGTWSVALTVGQDLPMLGRAAYGELATQVAKLLNCDDDCTLKTPVQQLVRQGVTMNFMDPNVVYAAGQLGLYLCDLFISTVNPNRLSSASGIYDPDRGGRNPHRIVT